MMRHRAAILASALVMLGQMAQADQPLMVQILRGENTAQMFEVELTGTLEAAESFPVAFRSGGRVIAVEVKVGDRVTAGEVLARLDPLQAHATARAADAQRAAALASLTQAELALNRARDLLQRGAGTRADLDAAQEAYLAAQASKDQAQAQVEKAEQAVVDTTITAPMPGIITARSAEPGQIAGAAQTVLTIAPDGQRDAVFFSPNVPELSGLMGRKLTVVPIDAPEKHMQAAISEVSPLVDVTSGTVLVRAKIDVTPSDVGLGVPVTAKVSLPLDLAVRLPWSALAVSEGTPAVWTVPAEGGAVTLRPVTIFRYTSDAIELSAGLAAGETVVGAGSHLLYPGRVVRPEPAAGTAP